MDTRPGSLAASKVIRVRKGHRQPQAIRDSIATEEPLEIRLVTSTEIYQVAVTMRTPGADFDLAAGFLFAEGVVHQKDDIEYISYCVDRKVGEAQRYNIVNVGLRQDASHRLDRRSLERHFMVSSACGVCGKASLDQVELKGLRPVVSSCEVRPETIWGLLSKLRAAQPMFEKTGGLHAAALFDLAGNLLAVREDVGRHNAMDKLMGWAVLQGKTPLANHIVLASGRSSFELIQKAAVANAPIFCAVSAPSSLAVDAAQRFGITLIGFLRDESFNIYCGQERITASQ